MSDLAGHIARIAQDDTLLQNVEAVTSQAAVLPVLDALGWDCWNHQEVTPQFSLRGGQVDYCLRDAQRNRNLVLIEVKRTGTELAGHQEQLLRYGFDEGVPLAALTDGRVWWLYLATENVKWEQRRFFSIEFSRDEQAAARAATDLECFLSRESVVGGGALEAARREFANRERERLVTAAMPAAWKKVLNDPDGLLIDLVADAVRDETGHRPDRESVREFLLGKWRQETALRPVAALPPAQEYEPRPQQRAATGARGRRVSPTSFSLDGRSRPVNNWPDLLIAVCNLLIGEAGDRFAERISSLRTRTRFTPTPEGKKPRQLANGMWLDVTLSANNSETLARNAVTAVRGPQGADSFRIDTTG